MNFFKDIGKAYNGHVLITAFVVGLFTMVMIGLQQTLATAENSIKSSLVAVAFLQSNITDADAEALAKTIQAQDMDIVTVTYTSKEQALEEAMKDPNLAKSLLLLKSNPLPPSLSIRYSDRAWWERTEPTQSLHGMPTIQEIRWDPQAASLFRSIHRWRLWCLRFSAFTGVILMVWAFIGFYRFLALHSSMQEVLGVLVIGAVGGILAWGLWGLGLYSMKVEISVLRPLWVAAIPLVLGAVSALGCFGLEVRHAE